MGFPSSIPLVTHQCCYNTDKHQPPDEHGDALWAMILDSPRGSHRYCDALATLLSSDHEQKLLYTLSDRSAIGGMLNVLELVRDSNVFSFMYTDSETFNPKESQATSSEGKMTKEQRKLFVLLKRMCRAHTKLPSSYVIEEGIETEGSHARAFGGAADVWKGRYNGEPVAIKSLRICLPQDDVEDDAGDKKVDREMWRLKQVRSLLLPVVLNLKGVRTRNSVTRQ